MTPAFHSLAIAEVRRETADAISVRFAVPAELRDAYRFAQGQFVTLKATVDGEELRRSYSVCCAVSDYEWQGELRVGIKRIEGQVLADNGPMLALCEQLGFALRDETDEPGVKHVTLDLASLP